MPIKYVSTARYLYELRDNENKPVKNDGGVIIRARMTEGQIKRKGLFTKTAASIANRRWVKVS